jgi:TRAP-type mannitol/chloroaromatic compound transport system permease small subunit
VVRKVFNVSSNAFLEVQWYLFAASFLLAAGYTLLQGEHVKVDVISSRLSKRTQIWIDVFGFIFFLTPMCAGRAVVRHSRSSPGFVSGEMSSNAGGLIRWPVYLMMPLGFGLLMLQGWSELIKRMAFLKGLIEDPTAKKVEKTAEEELAESIRRLAEAAKGNGSNQGRLSGDTHHGIYCPQPRPHHVCGAHLLPAAGLSGGVQPGRLRPVLRLHRHRAQRLARSAAAGPAAAHLRHHAERHAAGHSVLHAHGADS